MMNKFDRSDILFGVVTIPIFAAAFFMFFGRAASDPSFWLTLLLGLCCLGVVNIMRVAITKLARVPRFISWLLVGLAIAVLFTLARGDSVSVTDISVFALVLAIADLVTDKFSREEEVVDG